MRNPNLPSPMRDPINYVAERWPNAFACFVFVVGVIGGLCALAFGLSN